MKLGDLLFLEYRNQDDEVRTKITPLHFRAFYESSKISYLAASKGLKKIYEISGLGLAKWNADDAAVTRQIFER